jgi:3-oxoadipate enol-lactonase
MPRINAGSIELNYEIDGKGEALVFVNGITMDTNGWAYQAPFFSQFFKVIRYDCRGQGMSDKPDEQYSQQMHADDLNNLLEALNVRKIHLVGLSNGGMIAQHFALGYPNKLISLVLVDTSSYVDKLLLLMIDTWIKATEIGGNEFRYDMSLPVIFSETFIRNNEENLIQMKENNLLVNSPKAIINLVKATSKHDLNDRVSDINCPTLIIVGEQDILIPLKYSKILHEKIKGSELITIENCGHVPSIEKPAEFNEIVFRFLNKVINS